MLVKASKRVAGMVTRYDELLEDVYAARKTFAHLSETLVNPITVRFRPDAPPGYGTTYDMSKAKLPTLRELGNKLHEWQSIRAQLVIILEDPKTDQQSVMFLRSKLHVRVR